ncbi:hypothetical protein BDR06DRAFT_974673 [Suillus hirtellus]|nr:hypothetical protein BDR06DRAFT_974673 [Suillus hirtellus]
MEDMDEGVTSLDPVPDKSLCSNGLLEEQDSAAHTIQYAYHYHVWCCSGSATISPPSGIALTHAAKVKMKDLFNTESHEKLEQLGRQRSKIIKLEPSSPDHRTQDIDALKHTVLEVGEFIQKVPDSMMDMQAKFQMAYKGIIAEKKLFHVKNERPVLNVKDLDPIV